MNLHAPSRTVLVEVVARPAAPGPAPAGPVAAPHVELEPAGAPPPRPPAVPAPHRAQRTGSTVSTHRPRAHRP